MEIDHKISLDQLKTKTDRFWELSGSKILLIESEFDAAYGAPVYTAKGKYISRGWTEWTQGFQFGSAILQFDATGDSRFLDIGRSNTLSKMVNQLSHTGIHDHGFNNISTYGNLLRLMCEGKIPYDTWENNFYCLALRVSGAVQANRWTKTTEGGYIYSFNGPHSLFVDTIRTCRILMLAHCLGQVLQGENDVKISLFERAVQHLLSTARYSVYYGEGRDRWDVRGRTAHESIFNVVDGNFRCPNSQQGYSGFTTWTRGLAWAMLGFAEELEFIDSIHNSTEFQSLGDKEKITNILLEAAKATCDFYILNTPNDGIPYWDTGAPGLSRIADVLNKDADPFNAFEPVDSSAATIAAQGLLRTGKFLKQLGEDDKGSNYFQAGLTIYNRLLEEPYLCNQTSHQGLILHSIYHQPSSWDYVPEGAKIAYGESSMWGDYHARELALYIQRLIMGESYYSFYNCLNK